MFLSVTVLNRTPGINQLGIRSKTSLSWRKNVGKNPKVGDKDVTKLGNKS